MSSTSVGRQRAARTLISIAFFGLYQAIFIANGGAEFTITLPAGVADPAVFRDMEGLASGDGELIVVARGTLSHRLYRMLLNDSVDEGRLLEFAAGPITWDGESIGMLHSGPLGAATCGSPLPRFSLK